MKNLYSILQVDSQADHKTIKASYRRLARTYHPDLLSSDQREDNELLEKIQEINQAYDVLSDHEKRKEYDKALKEYEEKIAAALSPFEKRALIVKCAKTRYSYKMLLERKKGTNDKYKIIGFESLEKPLLPGNNNNSFAKVSEMIRRKPRDISPSPQNGLSHFATDKLDRENPLGIKHIAWRGPNHCPDCKTEFKGSNGSIYHWFVCGKCKHLFCAGNITKTFLNRTICWCPWCGKENLINLKNSGDKWGIRGEEFPQSQDKDKNLLSGEQPKTLSDGKGR